MDLRKITSYLYPPLLICSSYYLPYNEIPILCYYYHDVAVLDD